MLPLLRAQAASLTDDDGEQCPHAAVAHLRPRICAERLHAPLPILTRNTWYGTWCYIVCSYSSSEGSLLPGYCQAVGWSDAQQLC